MGKPNPDAMAPREYSKERANYRHHEQCGTCTYFNGRGKCAKVEGRISSDMVCDLWGIDEKPARKTGKQFIKEQYEKSKGR